MPPWVTNQAICNFKILDLLKKPREAENLKQNQEMLSVSFSDTLNFRQNARNSKDLDFKKITGFGGRFS